MKYNEIFTKLSERDINILFINLGLFTDYFIIEKIHVDITTRPRDQPNYDLHPEIEHSVSESELMSAEEKQNGVHNSKPKSNLTTYNIYISNNSTGISTPYQIPQNPNTHTQKTQIIKQSILYRIQREMFNDRAPNTQSTAKHNFIETRITNEELKKSLSQHIKELKVPESEIKLLTDNLAFKEWFISKTANVYETYSANDDIVNFIDSNQRTMEIKRNEIKQQYGLYNQKKLKIKDTKWLSENNNEQLEWAKKHLATQYRSLNQDISDIEKHRNILHSIECAYEISAADGELLLRKIKAAWSAKKHRLSGNAKKNLYFPLTMATEKRLGKLASHYGLKPHQYIEKLISEAMEKENL